MNARKFNDCFDAYLKNCNNSSWIKDESYKFYFANWITRKVNLAIQSKETILSYCKEALKKDYSLDHELSRIGVNFLQKSGREKLSIPIELSDIAIAQYLQKNEIPDEEFFKERGTSYPALAAWLGTLLPKKFIPIATSDFHETVSFLFDLEKFPQGGYQFFIKTQQYFNETKTYLKQYNLDHLYLNNIVKYLAQEYPKVEKKNYEEIDWNWITQDFHLFIFRKYLHDYPFKVKTNELDKSNIENKDENKEQSEVSFNEIDILEEDIYVPPPFGNDFDSDPLPNRNLKFDKDYYLKKYQNQIEKGSWSEEEVKKDEQAFLVRCGKRDLAEKVNIVSANPDLGFDILSYEPNGTEKQIEVKSISSDNPKSFFISSNELIKAKDLSNHYIYCVLSNSERKIQKIYRLKAPNLNDKSIFKLVATNFEVSFC